MLYELVRDTLFYITRLFYRDVTYLNAQNIPHSGPTVIYGNHNNQYVDGVVLTKASQRPVTGVIANISFKRPLVGIILKRLNAIGVQRPIDQKKQPGKGKIIEIVQNHLIGQDTNFSHYTVGTTLFVGDSYKFTVMKVISDTCLQIKQQAINNTPLRRMGSYDFSYLLKVDLTHFYSQLQDAFLNGNSVGIYPEGVSTNGPKLQKLNPGICKAAFEAIKKGCPSIKFIPCGSNYQNQSVFRSSMVMQVGEPFQIPKQLIEMYEVDQKRAIDDFLLLMQNNLRLNMTEAKSLQVLQISIFCQRLITEGSKSKIQVQQKLRINRLFAEKFSEDEESFRGINQNLKQMQFLELPYLAIQFCKWSLQLIKSAIYESLALFLLLVIMMPGTLLFGLSFKLNQLCVNKGRMKRFDQKMGQAARKWHRIHIVASEYVVNFLYTLILTCLLLILMLFVFTKGISFPYQLALAFLTPLSIVFYLKLFVRFYDRLKLAYLKLRHMYCCVFKEERYKKMWQTIKRCQQKVKTLKQEIELNARYLSAQNEKISRY